MKVLAAATVAGLLAVSCSGPGGGGPSQSSSAPPAASTRPSAAPTVAPTATVLACKLPLASADAPADGNLAHGAKGHGGFLDLPSGTFTADPNSLASYDLALGKWLPVPRAWVSPDGLRYAYPEYRGAPGPATGLIHIVDARSGADHAFAVPAPSMPISFGGGGVYIVRVIPNSDAGPQGLAVLDPSSSKVLQLQADGIWEDVGGNFAFGRDVDSSIPPPPPGLLAANRIRQLDLASKAVSTYLSRGGAQLALLGLDSRNLPIVSVQDSSGYKVVVYSGTGSDFTNLFSGAPGDAANPLGPTASSGAVSWLGSASGAIWQLANGALTRVATTPLQDVRVAGGCH